MGFTGDKKRAAPDLEITVYVCRLFPLRNQSGTRVKPSHTTPLSRRHDAYLCPPSPLLPCDGSRVGDG